MKEKVKKNRRFFPVDMSEKRKHLLFMNPGDVPIKEAIRALSQNTELPVWTTPFRDQLVLKGGRLYFDGLPMATKREKRHAVKKLYFDPKESIGIVPITDTLRKKYANISKTNVNIEIDRNVPAQLWPPQAPESAGSHVDTAARYYRDGHVLHK